MPDEARRLISPAVQIALAQLAERLGRKQDALPRWLVDLVTQYGVDCFARGEKHAYERNTTKPRDPQWDEVTPVDNTRKSW
jgi:hypothetical protein